MTAALSGTGLTHHVMREGSRTLLLLTILVLQIEGGLIRLVEVRLGHSLVLELCLFQSDYQTSLGLFKLLNLCL
jgi:hypothetical protein